MPESLERQQAEFAAALIDAAATTRVGRLLADPATAGERLRLYRGGIAATRLHALSSAYPVVRTLVGAEYFAGLCDAYAVRYPGTSGDLNLFGASLAQFVGGFASAASLPYLADVATLEWAVHRAYYAADAQPLPRERLATLTPAALLTQRFALQPACVWLTSKFPIATIWQAHQAGSGVALPADLLHAETALVVRPRWQVEVRLSSLAETAVLAELRGGATIGTAIEAGIAADQFFDFARALLRWLDEGLFVA